MFIALPFIAWSDSPQWLALFSSVPGGEQSYHRVELKFMYKL